MNIDVEIDVAHAGLRRAVRAAIVPTALALAGIGVIAGVAASLVLGGIIRTQLFGVTIFDPTTLASVIGGLMLSAALASLLPASRAARIDPVTAFRQT